MAWVATKQVMSLAKWQSTNLGESWSNASVDSAEISAQWLIQAIQKENEKFMNADNQKPEYLGIGTTVVGAILLPKDSFVLAKIMGTVVLI